jgi:hypothetical protein
METPRVDVRQELGRRRGVTATGASTRECTGPITAVTATAGPAEHSAMRPDEAADGGALAPEIGERGVKKLSAP